MNEEKKLSKVLDEIFGSYINSENQNIEEIEDIEWVNDYLAPQFDINNFIENLFFNKDIITEPNLIFNRTLNIKPNIQSVPTVTPPPKGNSPKFENNPKFVYIPKIDCNPRFDDNPKFNDNSKCDDNYKMKLSLLQQAYISKTICNQLYELFSAYSKFLRLSRINYKNEPVLKKQIIELMQKAEYIHKKITGKTVYYTNKNINFNSYNSALVFIKNKTNSILNDIAVLKSNTKDLEIKKYLIHIETKLLYQLRIIS